MVFDFWKGSAPAANVQAPPTPAKSRQVKNFILANREKLQKQIASLEPNKKAHFLNMLKSASGSAYTIGLNANFYAGYQYLATDHCDENHLFGFGLGFKFFEKLSLSMGRFTQYNSGQFKFWSVVSFSETSSWCLYIKLNYEVVKNDFLIKLGLGYAYSPPHLVNSNFICKDCSRHSAVLHLQFGYAFKSGAQLALGSLHLINGGIRSYFTFNVNLTYQLK